MSSRPSELSQEFIDQQRQRLLALRNQLLGGERRDLARERTFQREYGGEAQDQGDRARTLSQEEVDLATHNVDDRRIVNIERALQKIEEGSYGRSDLSDEPIPRARLEATPEAILTVQEERRQEAEADRGPE
jgi:DnaK suppressor protein